jgi:uncharacterized membrane protein
LDSATMPPGQTRTRTLFLLALLVVAVEFSLFYAIFLVIIPFIGLSILYYSALSSLVEVAINPVLLFYLFYRFGKHVNLSERYLSVIINTFLGGTIGAAVPQLILPFALQGGSGYFSGDFLSLITTLAEEAVVFVGAGMGTMFVAFTAVALANIRGTAHPTQPPQTTEQVSITSADNATALVQFLTKIALVQIRPHAHARSAPGTTTHSLAHLRAATHNHHPRIAAPLRVPQWI